MYRSSVAGQREWRSAALDRQRAVKGQCWSRAARWCNQIKDRWRAHAVILYVGKLLLDRVSMSARAHGHILGGAYIANFSQVGPGRVVMVIPCQGRVKHRCGTNLGVRYSLRHFVTGNGGDVLKLCAVTAMRGLASAGGPKVRQNSVRNQIGSIRVVGAESAGGATGRSSQTDMHSRGKINHVEGLDDSLGVLHRRRQMAGGKLAGQLRLNLVISKAAAGNTTRTVSAGGNDRDCGVELASSNGLVAACRRRSSPGDSGGGVFRQQVEISAAGDIGKELVDCARRSNHGVNVRSPENHHHM